MTRFGIASYDDGAAERSEAALRPPTTHTRRGGTHFYFQFLTGQE